MKRIAGGINQAKPEGPYLVDIKSLLFYTIEKKSVHPLSTIFPVFFGRTYTRFRVLWRNGRYEAPCFAIFRNPHPLSFVGMHFDFCSIFRLLAVDFDGGGGRYGFSGCAGFIGEAAFSLLLEVSKSLVSEGVMESPVVSGGLLEELESRHDAMLEELDLLDSRISEAITECQQLRKGIMGDEPDSTPTEQGSVTAEPSY